MLTMKLRRWITSQLRLMLDKEQWNEIDSMFDEVYLTKENGYEIISLKPPLSYNPLPGQIKLTYQFFLINGSFYAVDDWEAVKQRGSRLEIGGG